MFVFFLGVLYFLDNNPKALRTTTSEVSLLLGQKHLGTHVVAVFRVVKKSLDYRIILYAQSPY